MRPLVLREKCAGPGSRWRERGGIEVLAAAADRREEYTAIRDAAGLTDFSFVRAFRVPSEPGLDFLDGLLAGNVAKIRFGRVLHTFLADETGHLTADCYVANNDEELVFLCESIVPDAELDRILQDAGAATAGLEDLSATHAVLSLDGFKAWEIAREVFGADVLGLPYLSIETYPFRDASIRLFRAGKTSEFGYLLLVPMTVAGTLFDVLKEAVEKRGGRVCGVDVHDDLRLEGRFFNIHAEGRMVRDPLVLGLQWMIDFDKGPFRGSQAISDRRSQGLREKIIGVAAGPEVEALQAGARIYHGAEPVAEVVTSCFSFVLDRRLALARFPVALAYSGLTFRLGSPAGPAVETLSMPPIMPKSLTVKLDEM